MEEIKYYEGWQKILFIIITFIIVGIVGCIVIKNSRVNYDKDIQLFNKIDSIK